MTMRNLTLAAALAVLSAGVVAQDQITLANGDVLTGKITTMAEGVVTITSPILGDVPVKMVDIQDLKTGETVGIKTKSGDIWQRRITGIEGGNLVLEGGATSSLSLDDLGMINPPEKPQPKWEGSLNVGALWTNGNTSRKSASLRFEAIRASEIDRLTVDALWDYGEDKDVNQFSGGQPNPNFRNRTITQRRAGAGLKYDYFLGERSYALATSRVLGDTLADLKLRFTSGVGYGYTLIKDETTLFLIEAGLSYFSEDYRSAGLASRDSLAARIAYRYERQLSEDTKLIHRVEAYPSLEDGSDVYLQSVTELSTSLTDNMVATISHTLDYDNTPATVIGPVGPVGSRERVDNRVLLTIGWTF